MAASGDVGEAPDGADVRDDLDRPEPLGRPGDPEPPDDPGSLEPMEDPGSLEPPPHQWSRGQLALLGALAAVVLLVIGGTAGAALFAGRSGSGAGIVPGAASVDAGFSQDMIVHHGQGVLMAHLAERDSDDPEIQRYAYDMAYTQTAQIGQMQGWLTLWGLPEDGSGTHMAWMTVGGHQHGGGSDSPLATTGLMPGMATDADISKLQSLHGKASDIFFLQLMIRHHEGGKPMMQYAAEHAANPVVRNFAQQMLIAQSAEVIDMTTMLRERGAAPLPYTPPAVPGG